MKDFFPLITVFVSGLFGLLVAVLTWSLANIREKMRFNKELTYRDYKDKENIYLTLLSSLDKAIRYTKYGKDYTELIDEMTMNSAHINVFGAKSINAKLFDVSEKLYEWSALYSKSIPNKLKGTGVSIVSTEIFEFREKADNMYPQLIELIQDLTNEIKQELTTLRKNVEK